MSRIGGAFIWNIINASFIEKFRNFSNYGYWSLLGLKFPGLWQPNEGPYRG